MTNSETKNFSQNVSSSYYLRGKCSDECKKDSLNVPKLRFKGYNDEWKQNKLGNIAKYKTKKIKVLKKYFISTENMKTNNEGIDNYCDNEYTVGTSFIEDDILIANIRPYLRKFWFATNKGACSSDVLVLSPQQIYPLFLKYIISNDSFFSYVMIGSKGTKMPRGDKNHILEYKIWLPSLPEQEKIAAFLTLIDKKIEKQKELVELLKKYKRGLLSQIFSQKLRFKDKNGNNYPDWEEKTLGEVTNNISYGLNATAKKYDGKNKYIRITDIDEPTGKYNKIDIVSPDCDLSDEYKLKINDLLFARTGASTGKTYLYDENDGEMYFAGFLIKFSIKEEYCSDFVFYITQTYNYKKWVSIMSARSGQPGINAKEYSKYKFFCPVLEEQVKISNIISKLDNIIEKENLQLNLYNDYKKGLLQQMFI